MKAIFTLALPLLFVTLLSSCDLGLFSAPDQNVDVTLGVSETYTYNLEANGDEESARIEVQAEHAAQSEIVRNADTQWEVVYKYQPKAGFTGTDYVEVLRTVTGEHSDCPEEQMVIFRINVVSDENP